MDGNKPTNVCLIKNEENVFFPFKCIILFSFISFTCAAGKNLDVAVPSFPHPLPQRSFFSLVFIDIVFFLIFFNFFFLILVNLSKTLQVSSLEAENVGTGEN